MTDCFYELTDSQWQIIEKILDDKRKRWHSLRTICNAILWINRTGAQWRELDKLAGNYSPWQTVYYHFRQFKLRGVWEELLDSLVVKERRRQQREYTPSLLAIDSQSVKIMQFIAQETGIDGHKLINGRKRSIAVDRLGLPWSLVVTSANTSDNEAGRLVIDRLKGKVPRLKMIAADHGYKVSFVEYVAAAGYETEIVQKPESSQGFVPEKNGTGRPALASRTEFWLAQFPATPVSRCRKDGSLSRGYATNCIHLLCYQQIIIPKHTLLEK